MLSNYLRVALRTLRRQRAYAALSIVGLAIGLACCAVLVLYVQHERSYDEIHVAPERTYQVQQLYRDQWYSMVSNAVPERQAPDSWRRIVEELRAVDGVGAVTQLYVDPNATFLRRRGAPVRVQDVLYTTTGPALASTFGLTYREGTAASAWERPGTVVLTEPIAEALFAEGPAVGEIVYLDTLALEVSGVVAAWPTTSHFTFDVAINTPVIPYWGAYTYLRFADPPDVAAVRAQVTAALARANPRRAADPMQRGDRLVPLTDLHFVDDALYPLRPPGQWAYLWIFGITGALVLLVTIINYTNLAAAWVERRETEVGVRKVVGASGSAVALQFLCEALLIALASVPLALGLVEAALPAFNELMQVDLRNAYLADGWMLAGLVTLALASGAVAGLYPASIMAQRSVLTLFGQRSSGRRRLWARRALVVAQFGVVVALGSATWLVQQQLRYIQSKDLGLDTEGVITLRGVSETEAYARLRTLLQDQPAVAAVGWGGTVRPSYNQMQYSAEGADVVYNDANLLGVSLSWFDVMGVSSPDIERWQTAEGPVPEVLYFLNQRAADRLGWDDPVGKTVIEDPTANAGAGYPFTIDGVIDDFHLFSLHDRVRPLFVAAYTDPSWVYDMVVRVESDDWAAALGAIEEAWYRVLPDMPFDPVFAETTRDQLYQQDRQVAMLSSVLTGLAVLLAAFGLLGLAAFLAAARTKEIGIRKVLGATVWQILGVLNREIVLLVAVAALLAVPVAYGAAETWLDNFAYRIPISPWVFAGAGLSAVLLAVAAVSAQSFRTARANPVDSLRSE